MRPAELGDTFDLWYAARSARTGPPSPARAERVREKLAETGNTTYVAEVEGGVVGMVAAEPGRADDGRGAVLPEALHISMVFVAPEWQRLGVGSGLLRHVLAAAAEAGARSAALWTDTGNLPARRLYESLGMRPTRERQVTDAMRWVHYEVTFVGP